MVTTIPEKERGYDPGSVDKKNKSQKSEGTAQGHLTPAAPFLSFFVGEVGGQATWLVGPFPGWLVRATWLVGPFPGWLVRAES